MSLSRPSSAWRREREPDAIEWISGQAKEEFEQAAKLREATIADSGYPRGANDHA